MQMRSECVGGRVSRVWRRWWTEWFYDEGREGGGYFVDRELCRGIEDGVV